MESYNKNVQSDEEIQSDEGKMDISESDESDYCPKKLKRTYNRKRGFDMRRDKKEATRRVAKEKKMGDAKVITKKQKKTYDQERVTDIRRNEKEATRRVANEKKKSSATVIAKKLKKDDREERVEKIHEDDMGRLQELNSSILNMQHISKKDIDLMSKSQNFSKFPNLALVYFHLCGPHPDAFIFNDESLNGQEGEEVWKRLEDIIGEPIGKPDAERCYDSTMKHDPSTGRIAACSSCNEIIYECDGKINEVSGYENLVEPFSLTDEQVDKLRSIDEEIIREHISVTQHDGKYYHINPDLVQNMQKIVLCTRCNINPLDHPYSLASGHDYGRRGKLKKLNDNSWNAILPVRPYNIDILLRENHSTGHCIFFPSDGPVEISKVLPHLPENELPQATFLGPLGKWVKKKQSYRFLYEMQIEEQYKWLDVWKKIGHPSYKDIEIDSSDRKKEYLKSVIEKIEEHVIITEDKDINSMSDYVDELEEVNVSNDKNPKPNLIHSVVFPPTKLIGTSLNQSVEALIQIVLPQEEREKSTVEQKKESEESTEKDENDDGKEEGDVENEIMKDDPIFITRSKTPNVEWDENDEIFQGAFPDLFMLGKGCPKGSIPRKLLKHLFKFYDGRFDHPKFISSAFNQLQRHSCIRKAAYVGAKSADQMETLGELCNSKSFKASLEFARDNPLSKEAKRINAKVCKIVSMVGSTVPFSPFERASSRPKLAAMRYRYGISSHFLTGAPPEFEDLMTLRLSLITKWNDLECTLSNGNFKRSDLPKEIITDTGKRMEMTLARPSLAAESYQRKNEILLTDIIRCPSQKDSRVSRNYTERERGAFHVTAGCNGVTEPQQNGRLHWHMTTYASVLNPSLLTRLAGAPEALRERVGNLLDSISCTHLSASTRKRYENTQKVGKDVIRERAADVLVPNPSSDYVGFIDAGEKKISITNHHIHGFSCEKGKKGKYMCRLAMSRGIHEEKTGPLMIKCKFAQPASAKKKSDIEALQIDDETRSILNASYNPLDGEFIRPHTELPIIWEMHRPKSDETLAEANIIKTNILDLHNNASVINGEDSGEAVEQYEQSYMTKEGAPLRQAASVMLAAMEHIEKNPSVAEDKGTDTRRGKHLASRTVNAFSGSHQWSMPLMVHALTGHVSFFTTEAFRYVFPHANVTYRDNLENLENDEDDGEEKPVKDNDTFINECLDQLEKNIPRAEKSDSSGGTTSYKLSDDTIIFLSQAESYMGRGPHFENYSQIEFECIVELKKKRKRKKLKEVVHNVMDFH